MLQPDRLAPALDSALVVAFADPGEVGLEQVVADQRQKALRQNPLHTNDPAHGRLEIIVDASPNHSLQIGEGSHVAIQKRELVAAFIQPGELTSRVHQPQQKLPGLNPLPAYLNHHLEEIHLRFLARTVN